MNLRQEMNFLKNIKYYMHGESWRLLCMTADTWQATVFCALLTFAQHDLKQILVCWNAWLTRTNMNHNTATLGCSCRQKPSHLITLVMYPLHHQLDEAAPMSFGWEIQCERISFSTLKKLKQINVWVIWVVFY